MGGKFRVRKEIAKIIERARKPKQFFYDLFVGGANITGQFYDKYRAINDYNKYVIALYRAIADGWIPPCQITEAEYYKMRDNMQNYPDYLLGLVGFGCSFGAIFFENFAKESSKKNFLKTATNSVLSQKKSFEGIQIYNLSYDQVPLQNNSIIYCDPPYENTEKYTTGDFDTKKFWEWNRQKSKEHLIFTSEYKAPSDFICFWEKEQVNSLNNKIALEKLFVHERYKKQYPEIKVEKQMELF